MKGEHLALLPSSRRRVVRREGLWWRERGPVGPDRSSWGQAPAPTYPRGRQVRSQQKTPGKFLSADVRPALDLSVGGVVAATVDGHHTPHPGRVSCGGPQRHRLAHRITLHRAELVGHFLAALLVPPVPPSTLLITQIAFGRSMVCVSLSSLTNRMMFDVKSVPV